MKLVTSRFVPIALLMAAGSMGCASSGYFLGSGDGQYDAPRRWSKQWYEQEADSPVGARQAYVAGKLWPPFPRPAGKPQQLSHRYHAAHYWPYPYVCEDRAYIREVGQRQVNNGWITETTLYDYHFEDDGVKLDHSGLMHVDWILKHVPPTHRVIWVQEGFNPEQSQQRLAAVQTSATEIVGENNVPPIMLRADSPVGRPAVEIDMIRRAEMETVPDPRIEYEALPNGTGPAS